MPVNVTMPALSPTMTTGTLAKWTIAPGDAVHAGDVIAEIETDKATMEVEAIEDGVVAQILVEAGSENVAVGTVIAVLAEAGESVDEVASTAVAPVQSDDTVPPTTKTPADPVTDARSEKPADQPTETSTEQPTKPLVETETSPQKTSRIFATPLARRIAA
ncbi:MAG: biotin/lipoyl-containing protein, partial [Candidatus Puniceispirillaceae bacterium]